MVIDKFLKKLPIDKPSLSRAINILNIVWPACIELHNGKVFSTRSHVVNRSRRNVDRNKPVFEIVRNLISV